MGSKLHCLLVGGPGRLSIFHPAADVASPLKQINISGVVILLWALGNMQPIYS